MNEYLLIIVYVIGVVYSAFGYGVLVGSWDFDPLILLIFLWPLAMVVGPVLGLVLPFYVLGTKCTACIEGCQRRMELRRRERERNPLTWKQWCVGCFTEVICCPCIYMYVKCVWCLDCILCCRCCRRKPVNQQHSLVTTLQSSDTRNPKIEYQQIEMHPS